MWQFSKGFWPVANDDDSWNSEYADDLIVIHHRGCSFSSWSASSTAVSIKKQPPWLKLNFRCQSSDNSWRKTQQSFDLEPKKQVNSFETTRVPDKDTANLTTSSSGTTETTESSRTFMTSVQFLGQSEAERQPKVTFLVFFIRVWNLFVHSLDQNFPWWFRDNNHNTTADWLSKWPNWVVNKTHFLKKTPNSPDKQPDIPVSDWSCCSSSSATRVPTKNQTADFGGGEKNKKKTRNVQDLIYQTLERSSQLEARRATAGSWWEKARSRRFI